MKLDWLEKGSITIKGTIKFLGKLTKTLAEICLFVNEDFSRDDVPKGHKHLEQVLVSKLLGQVVDEQIGTFRACKWICP